MKSILNKQKKVISCMFPGTLLRTCLVLCLLLSVFTAYGQMANGREKWVGNIWYGGSEPLMFSTYWNQLTPENAGKWGQVEGTQDQMNWGQLDSMYNYAKSHGIPFKEHCFVWGSQEPGWVRSASASVQREEVEEWIRLYGERYPDTDYIDVVNEMFHVRPSYADAIGGNGATGWDWVVWAFEKARQYCPTAELHINEYNVIEGYTTVQEYANLVNILKSRGLIDGIGVQNHGLERTNLNDVRSRLTQLGNTGVPIYVTELDLDFGSDENAQRNRYAELFPVLYEHPAVAAITLWGYIEGHHWRQDAWILHSNGTERPALTWLKEYLASAPTAGPGDPTNEPTPTPTPGPTQVPGTISLACGSSSAVGNFQPDQYFSGGSTYNNSNTVDVSQITEDPPPAALFNNERYGAMSYTIPGFTSGSSYIVTLYFAETYLTSAGSRLFNVSINGETVLSSFDIYQSAGGQNRAIDRSFTTTANSSGQIVIQFISGTENPKINGISIQPGSGPTIEPTPTPFTSPTPVITPPPTGDCNVFFDPANSTQDLDSTFRIDVVVDSGNQKLAAYGFNITYDPAVLSVVDVEEGAEGFLAAANTTTPGEIMASGFDSSGTGPGSDLQVLIITFNAIAEGTSTLGLYVDQLVDGVPNPIGDACGEDGSVEVHEGTGLLGDANGDGEIGIVDALVIAQYYVDLDPSPFLPENADTDCDGEIDIVDALLVAQYYVDLIQSFC